MALTGTLRDFGIADILQLIGQQQKTGILHLKDKDQAVNVHFVDGNVVKAESATRSRKDLLGSMMVRSGVLAEAQLERALEIQKRTLRRLGDILISEGMVPREIFRELYQLQTTETLFRLFHWKDGTYAFDQQEVDYDKEAISPIRSENVLMEGFRMVDEWPLIRRRISSYEMTFERLREIAPAMERAAPAGLSLPERDPFDDALDQAFDEAEAAGGGGGGGEGQGDDERVGSNERRVWHLVEAGATVQAIIDRSRLGEFETCKSLSNLVDAAYLKPVQPARKGASPLAGSAIDLVGGLRRMVAQLAVGAAVLVGAGVLAYLSLAAESASGYVFQERATQDLVAAAQRERLAAALEVHRLEHGEYPESLEVLAESGLVGGAEVSYPYGAPWFYRRAKQEYVLLAPLP